MFAFTQTDLAGNPLETGVAVDHFNLVLIGNSFDELGSDNGLYDEIRRLHLAGCDTVLDDVVQEKQASLIAVNQHPFAFVVLACHTHAVCIRITCHYDVCINLLGEFDCHGKGFRIFRIRRNNCREISALYHLFGYTVHILKAPLFQGSRNEYPTCTMERSIDDAKVFLTLNHFRINGKGMDFIQIHLIYVLTDNLNQIFVAFELDVLNSHFVYLINNGCIVRGKHLRTIIPIGLVTVVFFRVMACSQVDTALAAQMTDSKGNLRSGTQILKEINLDAVCRKNISRDLSELTTVVTAIVAHYYGNLFFIFETFVQIVSQSLGSSAYRINIHTVAACAHDTTQAACTKFQVFIKTLYQFGFIWIFQHTFHFCLSFGIISRGKPFFSFLSDLFNQFLIFHKTISILKVNTSIVC